MLYVLLLLCVNQIADKITRKISYAAVLLAKKDERYVPEDNLRRCFHAPGR